VDLAGSSGLINAVNWLQDTLLGTAATSLCVIAMGLIGFMLAMGRLVVRDAVRIGMGCFGLLDAPALRGQNTRR
jgi:type IV secretion system protein VirB2